MVKTEGVQKINVFVWSFVFPPLSAGTCLTTSVPSLHRVVPASFSPSSWTIMVFTDSVSPLLSLEELRERRQIKKPCCFLIWRTPCPPCWLRTQLWSPLGRTPTLRPPPGPPLRRRLRRWCPSLRWRTNNLSPCSGDEHRPLHAAPWPERSGPTRSERWKSSSFQHILFLLMRVLPHFDAGS